MKHPKNKEKVDPKIASRINLSYEQFQEMMIGRGDSKRDVYSHLSYERLQEIWEKAIRKIESETGKKWWQ